MTYRERAIPRCLECFEELWGSDEIMLCIMCQRAEREEDEPYDCDEIDDEP